MNEQTHQKEIARGLRCYSVRELQDGLKYQREHYDWDFNNEREFIENLFCQRFNFLLVIYSLFITAAASTSSQKIMTTVLLLGTLLTLLVSLTIWRAYVKLIINLKILHKMPTHAFQFIQKETEALGWRALFGVNSIIGFWAPVFCTATLALGTVLAWYEIIKAS